LTLGARGNVALSDQDSPQPTGVELLGMLEAA
jgi:hypothetical protein